MIRKMWLLKTDDPQIEVTTKAALALSTSYHEIGSLRIRFISGLKAGLVHVFGDNLLLSQVIGLAT